jgi:hypothetical protein
MMSEFAIDLIGFSYRMRGGGSADREAEAGRARDAAGAVAVDRCRPADAALFNFG